MKCSNKYRSIVPQGNEWIVKTNYELESIKPVEESVRPVTPIRTVAGDGQTGDQETPPVFSSSAPLVCDDKSTSAPTPKDEEELVDYNSSPEHMNLVINIVHMSMDGYFSLGGRCCTCVRG
jgi:hypothetical protein